MTRCTLGLALSLLGTTSLGAQAVPHHAAPALLPAHRDSAATATVETSDTDEEGIPLGLQFGVASGALHYDAGRSEQALGAVVRWAPLRWLSLSATPTALHQSTPAIGTAVAERRSGLVDLPVDLNVTHGFATLPFAPTLSAGIGATLPVGDTASGFGAGSVGYSVSAGLGLAPLPRTWVHLGAGHSLSEFSVQSAFTAASGWGDASAGVSVTDRLSPGASRWGSARPFPTSRISVRARSPACCRRPSAAARTGWGRATAMAPATARATPAPRRTAIRRGGGAATPEAAGAKRITRGGPRRSTTRMRKRAAPRGAARSPSPCRAAGRAVTAQPSISTRACSRPCRR